MKQCVECKQIYPFDHFGANGVNSKISQTPKYKPRCRTCHNIYQTNIFRQKIQRIYNGKLECVICGYDKCFGALEFHHLDPSTKEHTISRMTNYSEKVIRQEIEKCVMLCANCHREVHAGITSIPNGR